MAQRITDAVLAPLLDDGLIGLSSYRGRIPSLAFLQPPDCGVYFATSCADRAYSRRIPARNEHPWRWVTIEWRSSAREGL